MNIVLYCNEQPDFDVLNAALQKLNQLYRTVGIVGVVYSSDSASRGVLTSNKPLPVIDKNQLPAIEYDLVLVTGVGTVSDAVRDLNIDADKIILDKTVCVYGFSLDSYQKLRRSKLSIISMNSFGALIGETLGISNIGVKFSFTEKDFLKFLRDPLHYLKFELRLYKNSSFLLDDIELQSGYNDIESARTAWEDWRLNFNPFNTLAVMYTDKPEVLAEFDKLPYAKKVCFVPFDTDLDSGYYVRPYYIGGRSLEGAVNKIAANEHTCYNVWDILLHIKKTPVNIMKKDYGDNITPKYYFASSDRKIQYFDFFARKDGDHTWLTRFIKDNVDDNKAFNIFSVYGDHRFIRKVPLERKIFYVGEEVFSWPSYDDYRDYCLNDVDLVLGFEDINADNYVRLPLWMLWFFVPKVDINVIRNTIAWFNGARNTKKYECVLINGHDQMNTRTPIYERLKDILQIRCAGKWNRNTDELQTVYNNDKLKYVHEFMFNICPENVNHFGYVTEKLFDAFAAGAIPIYHGSDNNPEEEVVNKDAVLFWNPDSDNEELVKEVIRLKSDAEYYDKFMRQEKLRTKTAAEYIYATFEKLAQKLRAM